MKIQSAAEMEIQARRAIERCLADIPFVKLEAEPMWPNDGNGADRLVRLRLPDGERLLLIEVKTNGQPRWTRDAINQLCRYRQRYLNGYGIFIAPYISPQSAALCAEEGIGYLDLAGNCRLTFDQVYIRQEGHPNPYGDKRPLRALYGSKSERVLRVLLMHPRRAWKIEALAREAEVSVGEVAKVKAHLADREWIRMEKDGFRPCNPEALLTDWAENARPSRSKSYAFYSLKSVADNEYDLAVACRKNNLPFALTGLSGAAHYAPYLRYQKVTAYVNGDIVSLASRLGWKPVSSGANVSLLSPYDAGVLYGVQEKDTLKVAAPIQTYLDLQSEKGRSAEAAAHLRENIIQPTW